MDKPLDELYLRWLYSQVCSLRIKNPARTYWSLARKLYTTEFTWFVYNDDNRAADGQDLRYEFIDAEGLDNVDPQWLELGCSMLELLIGLSRRLSFLAEGEPRDWFWHLIDNLDLRDCTDRGTFPNSRVEEVLNTVIQRTYKSDGTGGGLFPLHRANKDQRGVEIWYQLNEYLLTQN